MHKLLVSYVLRLIYKCNQGYSERKSNITSNLRFSLSCLFMVLRVNLSSFKTPKALIKLTRLVAAYQIGLTYLIQNAVIKFNNLVPSIVTDLQMFELDFKALMEYWFIHKNNFIPARNMLKDYELQLLKFGSFHFKRYLLYFSNQLSYNKFNLYNKAKNLQLRVDNVKPKHAEFLGFKLRCSGRFSRRQRASSY